VLGAVLLLSFLAFGRSNDAVLETTLETNGTPNETSGTVPSASTTNGTGSPTQTSSDTALTAKLNEKISFSGGTGMVTEVLEDSRCPVGTQCAEAGTVRVKVNFTYGILSQNINLTLNEPYTYSGSSITLVKVSPEKTSTASISPGDYVFSFLIK
ncbi:MAG: hypothetical protein WD963_02565, partial [Candidatus Paceibacterota bacterium]